MLYDDLQFRKYSEIHSVAFCLSFVDTNVPSAVELVALTRSNHPTVGHPTIHKIERRQRCMQNCLASKPTSLKS